MADTDNAYDVLIDLLRSYGLDSLGPAVLTFLQDGYTQEQVNVMIQDTPEYKTRFAGNDKRRAAGIPVLSPRDYLSVESSYRQILSSNGMPLGFYDSPSDFADWIGKDVAPTEVASRVDLAVTSANELGPEALNFVRNEYGLQRDDLAAFFLDQERAFPLLRKQEKAMRIGGDAARDGLSMNRDHAEQLAGYAGDRNVDQMMAQVAQLTKRGTELSNIHGGADYMQGDAESETFQTSEAARRKRAGLVAMEDAAFSGTSGVGKTTLSKAKSY